MVDRQTDPAFDMHHTPCATQWHAPWSLSFSLYKAKAMALLLRCSHFCLQRSTPFLWGSLCNGGVSAQQKKKKTSCENKWKTSSVIREGTKYLNKSLFWKNKEMKSNYTSHGWLVTNFICDYMARKSDSWLTFPERKTVSAILSHYGKQTHPQWFSPNRHFFFFFFWWPHFNAGR